MNLDNGYTIYTTAPEEWAGKGVGGKGPYDEGAVFHAVNPQGINALATAHTELRRQHAALLASHNELAASHNQLISRLRWAVVGLAAAVTVSLMSLRRRPRLVGPPPAGFRPSASDSSPRPASVDNEPQRQV